MAVLQPRPELPVEVGCALPELTPKAEKSAVAERAVLPVQDNHVVAIDQEPAGVPAGGGENFEPRHRPFDISAKGLEELGDLPERSRVVVVRVGEEDVRELKPLELRATHLAARHPKRFGRNPNCEVDVEIARAPDKGLLGERARAAAEERGLGRPARGALLSIDDGGRREHARRVMRGYAQRKRIS